MARVYVDTNVLIGFYESTHDPIAAIDEVAAYASHLVVPEQTILEFSRNRLSALNFSIKQFKESTRFTPYRTSLISHQPQHKELLSAIEKARDISKGITKRLEDARNILKDDIAQKILSVLRSKQAYSVATSDAIFSAAQRRKLLGQPPLSKDKYSIGDEIIWESLLQGAADDLVLVTRDNGFIDQEQTLVEEYLSKTGKRLLGIKQHISEAIRILGHSAPPKLVEQEKFIDEEHCVRCGKKGEVFSLEGGDGDEAAWFECSHCGHVEFFQ